MQASTNCPKCGSNNLHTNHTGFGPGNDEDIEEFCLEEDCDWSRREQDNSANLEDWEDYGDAHTCEPLGNAF